MEKTRVLLADDHAVVRASSVIMISAYPDREFHRLSLEAGEVAFLDKKDLDAVTLLIIQCAWSGERKRTGAPSRTIDPL